jgi:hypothetical protein
MSDKNYIVEISARTIFPDGSVKYNRKEEAFLNDYETLVAVQTTMNQSIADGWAKLGAAGIEAKRAK